MSPNRAILWVAPEAMVNLLNMLTMHKSDGFVVLPDLRDSTCCDDNGHSFPVPDDIQFDGRATHDWARQMIGFSVTSQRFEEVMDGAEPPSIRLVSFTARSVPARQEPDGAIVIEVP